MLIKCWYRLANKRTYRVFRPIEREVNIMELKDTIEGMTSEDYKERFKAEYNQVVIRRNKLYKMLSDYVDNKPCFEPNCNISLLATQLDVMNAYINLLGLRAQVEEIDLDYPPRVEE